jgi:hypothetical protein
MTSWLVLAVVLCCAAMCCGQGSSQCTLNSWTNPVSGNWAEAFWSCDHLPYPGDVISFTNAGSKVLFISSRTAANFADSLSPYSLVIGAPAGSSNTLMLDHAGTNVALSVQSFWADTNGMLVSYDSALNAETASFYSDALFAENSKLQGGFVRNWSTLTISNSIAAIRTGLHSYPNSVVNQWGSASEIYSMILDGDSTFTLNDGTFNVHELCLMAYPDFYDGGFVTNSLATLVQAGGDTTVDIIKLGNLAGMPGKHGQGRYVLQSGTLSSTQYVFYNGSFVQLGGTNILDSLTFPEPPPLLLIWSTYGSYELSDGLLLSGSLAIGAPGLAGERDFTHDGCGSFQQSGGVHLNSGGITVPGFLLGVFGGFGQFPHRAGTYSISGGILVCSNLNAGFGGYFQSGGTNYTTSLTVGGYSMLTGGELITSNSTVYGYEANSYEPCMPSPAFAQSNGTHCVQGKLLVEQSAVYDLLGGAVNARDIELDQNTVLNCQSGIISNWGDFIVSGAVFYAGTQSHHLGKLRSAGPGSFLLCPLTNSTFDVAGPAGTFLRFLDSREASIPSVQILNWQPWGGGGGSHHIFFGTNAQALTQQQLKQLVFVNPLGWPPGNYPARILATGEIVPAESPPVIVNRLGNAMLLSWSGDYELLTATNVFGPYSAFAGARTPFTNDLTGPERYFRLRLTP